VTDSSGQQPAGRPGYGPVGGGMRHARFAALAAPAGVAALAGAGCAAVWWADPTTPGGLLPVCPTKALLGINCPGCGGLRMVYSLLHGDLVAAVQFNAVALVALPLMLWAWVAWVLARRRGHRRPVFLRYRWAPAAILAVMLAWFVVRNIPIEPFTSLRV